jgi:hypothetical protein
MNKHAVGVVVFLSILACPAAAQRMQPAGVTHYAVAESSSHNASTLVADTDVPSTKRRVVTTVLGALAGSAFGAVLGYNAGNGSSTCSETCVRQPNYVLTGALLGLAVGALLGYTVGGGE